MSSNVRQLLDNGVPVYPITDKSLVIGLQDAPFESYVVAWDGASTPVVANIPAGVVVTYNTTNYTGTLAASASTAPYLYLVASTTQQGEYDRYITTHTGNAYAWTALGSTQPVSPVIVDNLTTNDASKALSAKQGKVLGESVSQLEHEMDELYLEVGNGEMSYQDITADFVFSDLYAVNGETGGVVANSNYNKANGNGVDVSSFAKIRITVIRNTGTAKNGTAFYDEDDIFISGVWHSSDPDGGARVEELTVPENAKYVRTTYRQDSFIADHPEMVFDPFYCGGLLKGAKDLNTRVSDLEEETEDIQEKLERIEDVIESNVEDITSRFSFTDNEAIRGNTGVLVGASTDNKATEGYIDISKYTKLQLTLVNITGTATNGCAFYSDANESSFISGVYYNGQPIAGGQVREITVPDGAKYIRTTYRMDSFIEDHPELDFPPFSCKGVFEGSVLQELLKEISDLAGQSGDIPYDGEKVSIRDSFKLSLEKIGEANVPYSVTVDGVAHASQGMCIYGNKMFNFFDAGYLMIHDLSTDACVVLSQFKMHCWGQNYHLGIISMGMEKPSGSDFPAVYYYGNTPFQCQVCSVSLSETELVQTITIANTSDFAGYDVRFLAGNGYLWAKGQPTGSLTDSGKLILAKYRLPKLSEGASVTLTAADMIEITTVDNVYEANDYTLQGSKVRGDKMYLAYGATPYKRRIFVIDLGSYQKVTTIDLTSYANEMEDLDFYDNKIYVVQFGASGVMVLDFGE